MNVFLNSCQLLSLLKIESIFYAYYLGTTETLAYFYMCFIVIIKYMFSGILKVLQHLAKHDVRTKDKLQDVSVRLTIKGPWLATVMCFLQSYIGKRL